MGKKYIIELEDKPFHKHDGDFLYRVEGFNSLVFDMTGISKLKPYTEPDIERVRKEAYKDGYKTAKVQCNIQAEKDLREVGKRHYQKGLSDAWEAARKIIHMPEGNLLNVFTECYSAVCTALQVILKYNASEAIEKLKAYEQKQEEIKVGDEVIYNGRRCVVIVPETTEKYGSVMDAEGGRHGFENGEVEKTGRHFPEIAAVIEKMRGEQDE